MRFKAVISLCKKAKQVVLCDHKGVQWIGDGAALYAMYDMPKLDEGAICAVCDITDSQAEKIHFMELSNPKKISLANIEPEEVLLDQEALVLKKGTLELLGYRTTTGMEFIDAAYMRPFGNVESDLLDVYERRTPDGDPYFAVKAGLILLGIVTPVRVINDGFMEDLRRIADGCALTLEHEKTKAAEDDGQMRMEEQS